MQVELTNSEVEVIYNLLREELVDCEERQEDGDDCSARITAINNLLDKLV